MIAGIAIALLLVAPNAQVRIGPPTGERQAAVLARRPMDLPRAPAGRWVALADPERRAEALAAVDPRALEELRIAEAAYAQRLLPRALESLHAALEIEPDFPPAWLVTGATYLRLRWYSYAAHAYERYLTHAPDEAWRTQGLGHALHALGRFEEARDHYARVLAAFDSNVEARRGIALAELRLGDHRAAIGHLDRLLEARPDDAEALAWRAEARLGAGDAEGAFADATRAETLSPGEARPVWVAMQAAAALGREDEVVPRRARHEERVAWAEERRSLEQKLLRDARQPLLARELVKLARKARDPNWLEDALGFLDRSRSPDQSPVPNALVALEAWLELDRLEEARAAAAALEGVAGDSRTAWQRLALFWSLAGDPERAEAAHARARGLAEPPR